jgi:hypothetical protein
LAQFSGQNAEQFLRIAMRVDSTRNPYQRFISGKEGVLLPAPALSAGAFL